MIVAIDGPAGAGKSTIAKTVAAQLGFQFVDTGAMYRTVAYKALTQGVALDDGAGLAEVARSLTFSFSFEGNENTMRVDGEPLGPQIRTEEVSQAASKVAALPQVRDALLDVQRICGRSASSVLEGRDIGTVVFPDAELKIFLTASPDVRAKRRLDQLGLEGDVALDKIKEEILERDERDENRETAPLKAAEDAIHIDTSELTIDEIVTRIMEAVHHRRLTW